MQGVRKHPGSEIRVVNIRAGVRKHWLCMYNCAGAFTGIYAKSLTMKLTLYKRM